MQQINAFGQQSTPIHFVFQVNPERIACMPQLTEFHQTRFHPVHKRSNDPRAVTCQQCKTTGVYKQARGRNG